MQDQKMTDQIAKPENAGPENAGLENDRLEFDGPEQRAVMSLVQEDMHTLKTVAISLRRYSKGTVNLDLRNNLIISGVGY